MILALGKLGGVESNYSSDIDLIFLYDADGKTGKLREAGRRQRGVLRAFGEGPRWVLTGGRRIWARFTGSISACGPDGGSGPIVASVPGTLHYYDLRGRTWERQAYIKARVAAGDRALGEEFLEALRPWVYRRYLSRADISGIRAETPHRGADASRRRRYAGREDGPGRHPRHRVRDQFLPVAQRRRPARAVHGKYLGRSRTGELAAASSPGTVHPPRELRFLRKIEHRLRSCLTSKRTFCRRDADEMRKLAVRMGYAIR